MSELAHDNHCSRRIAQDVRGARDAAVCRNSGYAGYGQSKYRHKLNNPSHLVTSPSEVVCRPMEGMRFDIDGPSSPCCCCSLSLVDRLRSAHDRSGHRATTSSMNRPSGSSKMSGTFQNDACYNLGRRCARCSGY
jgi:hypothetical protein